MHKWLFCKCERTLRNLTDSDLIFIEQLSLRQLIVQSFKTRKIWWLDQQVTQRNPDIKTTHDQDQNGPNFEVVLIPKQPSRRGNLALLVIQ